MNWTLVLPLAAIGPAMGLAAVLGLTTGIEGYLWLGFALLAGIRIGVQERAHPFRHGFVTGLIAGSTSPLIEALFVATYLGNNPDHAADFAAAPAALGPRGLLLAMAPVSGLASGALLGLLALGTSRLGAFLHRVRHEST